MASISTFELGTLNILVGLKTLRKSFVRHQAKMPLPPTRYSVIFIGLSNQKDSMVNVDKAKKRISKRVKRGFKGYPQISLDYFGKTTSFATEVVITFLSEENAEPQIQRFTSEKDVREDEAIQSVLLKIIERAEANTVVENTVISVY
ncbi:hypothetical protein [Nitrincola sp. A-D6]|uniref:hypothetical protein n=1 Tax=Nitrincola sp. A-D6 TaxID=1545442 RepID=UPI001F444B0C|nr:hypothetical protein [Nitrincola sp. A-D6]